ncbi:MAG TPA: hypothetical protein PLD51_02475 [Pontiellaceae bacterium]|nr:hypothetical protein [Pontiellaceae bacterium]HPR82701.1 hypothetical protein [Pontiellaceae bacterium]
MKLLRPIGISLLSGCILVVTGCASILERQTIRNTNNVGQSMWEYDRGPYPGIGLYVSNFQQSKDSQESRNTDFDEVGPVEAVVLGIIVTPFWIADVILCTALDTVLLPYDLVMWEKENTNNSTSASTASNQPALRTD